MSKIKNQSLFKIIFLDRDGVINKDPGEKLYVMKPQDFEFLPGALDAIKKLNDDGYKIAVVSNQAGVSKGLFTESALDDVHRCMMSEIERFGARPATNLGGARIDKALYCTHRDEDNCDCRKPKVGLIKRAADELNVPSDGSFLIGDGKRDVEAGRAFGLRTILVLSGKTKLEDVDSWKVKPDFIKRDLLDAVNWIITETKKLS